MCGRARPRARDLPRPLIRQGFRVAICDQMETPEEAKRRKAPTIRREVVRLVTPGTVTEDALLEAARPAWLLALALPAIASARRGWMSRPAPSARKACRPPTCRRLLARLEPSEVLAPEALARGAALAPLAERIAHLEPPRDGARRLAEAFSVATLDGFGAFAPEEAAAAAMAVDYVRLTQAGALPRLSPPVPAGARGLLQMDGATRRSLEILRSERGEARHSLLAAVDRTVTAAGARELAARLAAPLAEAAPIAPRPRRRRLPARRAGGAGRAARRAQGRARHGARAGAPLARPLRPARPGRDPGRPRARRGDGRRDRRRRRRAARARAGGGRARCAGCRRRTPAPNSPARWRTRCPRGSRMGAWSPGYDGELDALRRLAAGAREAIAALQMDLAQGWGVASLKIRHHSNSASSRKCPPRRGRSCCALRAQGRAARTRPSPDHGECDALHLRCAGRTRPARGGGGGTGGQAGTRRRAASAAAVPRRRTRHRGGGGGDGGTRCPCRGGRTRRRWRWCRPEIGERPDFAIAAGRHPVVEAALARARGPAFVPNDCDLSPGRGSAC